MYLSLVTSGEVLGIIKGLRDSAAGEDHVRSRILIKVAQSITDPLTCIINLSFRQGIFLQALKRVAVTPVYKVKDRTMLLNY